MQLSLITKYNNFLSYVQFWPKNLTNFGPPPKYDLNKLNDLHNLVDGDHNVHHNIVVHDGDVAHAAVAAGDTFAVVVAVADRVDHVSFVGVGGASPRPNHFGQAPTFLPV